MKKQVTFRGGEQTLEDIDSMVGLELSTTNILKQEQDDDSCGVYSEEEVAENEKQGPSDQ